MLESCRAGFGFSYQSSRASCRSRKFSASLCWDRARLHLDNKTAVYYIRKQGGTRSSVLRGEACLLQKESIQRGIILLNPHQLAMSDNVSKLSVIKMWQRCFVNVNSELHKIKGRPLNEIQEAECDYWFLEIDVMKMRCLIFYFLIL